jgi:MOSC domain-containing protein YiiM
MNMPEVKHLFLCKIHRFPMEEVEEALAIYEQGLKGCIHGRKGSSRQISLMDCETLARFGLAPGVVKENITTVGMDFQVLATGMRLRIGGALLEISGPCHPCARMDDIRKGLRQELKGQRGWLCRVVEQGTIRRGDAIEVAAALDAVGAAESRDEVLKT